MQAPDEALRLYPDHDPKAARTKYMACVTHMDRAIGEMLDLLERLGLERETLVVFHSDNGGGGPVDNRPLRGHKGQMFEGGLRVPCIVRWPGRVPPGTTSDAFLTTLELFPTLVGAAGAKRPEGVVLDGFDMLPTLQGKAPSPRSEMFWERRGDRAAQVGTTKWVESEDGGGLFDLSRDIAEKEDLSRTMPGVLADLKAAVRGLAWGDGPGRAPRPLQGLLRCPSPISARSS